MEVSEEWCSRFSTSFIISPTCDEQRIIAGQVVHGVSEASHRFLPIRFYLLEFAVHNFAINHGRFKVSEFILEFALLVLSSEKVDALLDLVTFARHNLIPIRVLLIVAIAAFSWKSHTAASSLNKGGHARF